MMLLYNIHKTLVRIINKADTPMNESKIERVLITIQNVLKRILVKSSSPTSR